MKNILTISFIVCFGATAFAQATIGEMIANEKTAIEANLAGAENYLKLKCQDELQDLLEEVSTMSAANASEAELTEQLELITMRREYVESPESSCVFESEP